MDNHNNIDNKLLKSINLNFFNKVEIELIKKFKLQTLGDCLIFYSKNRLRKPYFVQYTVQYNVDILDVINKYLESENCEYFTDADIMWLCRVIDRKYDIMDNTYWAYTRLVNRIPFYLPQLEMQDLLKPFAYNTKVPKRVIDKLLRCNYIKSESTINFTSEPLNIK